MISNLKDDGVSPVVGVMLMLVVTIIIAAVVSAFSGGMMEGSEKSPTLSMDIKIANTGSWVGSGFSATVTGVSAPISTADLRLSTSWSVKDEDGNTVVGGSTISPGVTKGYDDVPGAPFGFGNGVSGSQNLTFPYSVGQFYGNYTLVGGTTMLAAPWGAKPDDPDAVGGAAGTGHQDSKGYGIDTPYENEDDAGVYDAAEFVLGENWEDLRAGDSVQVNIVYLPTGKVILDRTIKVTE